MYYLLIALLIVIVWRNSSRTKTLQARLDQLEKSLNGLRRQLESLNNPKTTTPTVSAHIETAQPLADADTRVNVSLPLTDTATKVETVSGEPNNSQISQLTNNIQQNWMLWLGGLCVALAGIFLAKYSVEQGLFGPSARVTMGLMTGLALHGAAEWFRRKTGESNPSFAALAGGGSITLFAIILAALHMYQMVSPAMTFVLLAIIALATMLLSLRHGPALAAIGLLGAYAVPIFVSTGSGAILFAMGYALLITAAGLLLLRYVYRSWLWRGILLGALAWWAISLNYPSIVLEQAWYLAALAYFLIAIPGFNWLLKQPLALPDGEASTLIYQFNGHTQAASPAAKEWQLRIGVYIIIAAQCFMLLTHTHLPIAVYAWTPLLLILLLTARHREAFTVLPWTLVLVEIAAIAFAQLHQVDSRFEFLKLENIGAIELTVFSVVSSFVIIVFGWVNLKESRFTGIWSSFITLAPLLLVTLTYFLTSNILTEWQWICLTLCLAALYLFIAGLEQKRNPSSLLLVWLVFAGHFAASIAAVILTQEGRLTTAIALQVVSTAWIIQNFKLPQLGWLLKLLVAIVVIRLTLNPWMVSYANDTHWSLLTFGGSTLCCVVAMRLLRPFPALAKWAEAAALHLFVLFVWSELRYWLNDGDIFANSVSLLEASLTMTLFGALSLVYYRRSLVSQSLQQIYLIFSYILMGLALCYYAMILLSTLIQHSWVWANIANTPIFNGLLLSFGMPVVLGWLTWRYHHEKVRRAAITFTGAAAFIFINLQIKHLWQGDIRLYESMQSSELYTYSVVWLGIAVAFILGGAIRISQRSETSYRAGLGLLGLVIAKLFLVDMSDLDGLLRVASFMGLGLSLLAISYLHQRIQKSKAGDIGSRLT